MKILETATISLSQRRDGFYLYDGTRRMNLSMKAKTKEEES